MRSFWLALQFLTRLPTPALADIDARQVGRSLVWYPLVGILLGTILWSVASLLPHQEPLLVAACVLTLWVALTGALHLDGLADTADAWVGGLGDRERTLDIMKDPACGPSGVTALVLVLLLKFVALAALLRSGEILALLLVPPLARSGVALLFVTTPYVRPGGLGEALANHVSRGTVMAGAMLTFALLIGMMGVKGAMVLTAALLLWLWLRQRVIHRLGGFTGDIAGAMLELLETATLLVFALLGPYI